MAGWEYLEIFVKGGGWIDSSGREGKLSEDRRSSYRLYWHPLAAVLQERGTEGWELVAAVGGEKPHDPQFDYRLFLKRPKQI